ncbi:hypothetical protein XENTR_v10007509 [Xenopus tropicalis]|nr:hypothetical protein XENTR_v10007509 [Xenopus tropicalis]
MGAGSRSAGYRVRRICIGTWPSDFAYMGIACVTLIITQICISFPLFNPAMAFLLLTFSFIQVSIIFGLSAQGLPLQF